MVRLHSVIDVPKNVFNEECAYFGINYHLRYMGCSSLFCCQTPIVYGAPSGCPYLPLRGYGIQFDKVCVQYWNIRMLSISSFSTRQYLSAELLSKESPIVLITAW